MTGQDFLALQQEKIFRPALMDAIINEFEPPADMFKFTEKFLPLKNVEKDEMIALVKGGTFGMTNPVNLGAEHVRVGMPSYFYKAVQPGYWRESIMFDEEVLTSLKRPDKPDELWGEGLVGEALNVLDMRLNVLIEHLSAVTVQRNGYSINRNNVSYTYNASIPSKYYLYLGLAAEVPVSTEANGLVSGSYQVNPFVRFDHATHAATDLWSALTTSQPLRDLRHAIHYFSDQGFTTTQVWMSRNVAGLMEDNTTSNGIRGLVEANPAAAGKMITAELIITALVGIKGLTPVIDDRRYLEESPVMRAALATDTVIYLADVDSFAVGDWVTIRNDSTGTEEDRQISAVSSANRTITVGAITYSLQAGTSRVTCSKNYMMNDRVIFCGEQNERAPRGYWVSTPSLVKAQDYKNPVPGRYTWTYFNTKVPYYIETGAGIHGGPQVLGPGGWLTMVVRGKTAL